ncbi:hypothetical protein D3C80_1869630 [compost metagenome]
MNVCAVLAANTECNNPAPSRRAIRAVQLDPGNTRQPLVQLLDTLLQLPGNFVHADFLEQRQAGLQRASAEHVRAAAFEPPCAAGGLPLAAFEVTHIIQHVPAIGVEP